MGSYAAFAALGTTIMLKPQKAQALSIINPEFTPSGFRSTRRNTNKK